MTVISCLPALCLHCSFTGICWWRGSSHKNLRAASLSAGPCLLYRWLLTMPVYFKIIKCILKEKMQRKGRGDTKGEFCPWYRCCWAFILTSPLKKKRLICGVGQPSCSYQNPLWAKGCKTPSVCFVKHGGESGLELVGECNSPQRRQDQCQDQQVPPGAPWQ